MNRYLDAEAWRVVEKGFNPDNMRSSESMFSIGNGRFGQRANHEEGYSGDHMLGSYVGGVYYPDRTKVGWWKNGYPEYFAKVLNATNWTHLGLRVNGMVVDLAKAQEVRAFESACWTCVKDCFNAPALWSLPRGWKSAWIPSGSSAWLPPTRQLFVSRSRRFPG